MFGVDLLELEGSAAAQSFRLGLRPFSLTLGPADGTQCRGGIFRKVLQVASLDNVRVCVRALSLSCLSHP